MGVGAELVGAGGVVVAVLWWRVWRVERDVQDLRGELREAVKDLRLEVRNAKGGGRA